MVFPLVFTVRRADLRKIKSVSLLANQRPSQDPLRRWLFAIPSGVSRTPVSQGHQLGVCTKPAHRGLRTPELHYLGRGFSLINLSIVHQCCGSIDLALRPPMTHYNLAVFSRGCGYKFVFPGPCQCTCINCINDHGASIQRTMTSQNLSHANTSSEMTEY